MVGLNGTSYNQPVGGDADDAPWPPVAGSWLEPVDEYAQERCRLEAELAAATERIATAKERAAAREAEVRDALRAELAEAQRKLADMEREHEAALAKVRAETQAEVDRIMADARRKLAAAATSPERTVP
jgi:hypothetical protein